MDLDLGDKRALVTGSSAGIGEAIARTLAREGAIVAIHGRDRSRVEHVRNLRIDGGSTATIN